MTRFSTGFRLQHTWWGANSWAGKWWTVLSIHCVKELYSKKPTLHQGVTCLAAMIPNRVFLL